MPDQVSVCPRSKAQRGWDWLKKQRTNEATVGLGYLIISFWLGLVVGILVGRLI